jgi:hypothetical protein
MTSHGRKLRIALKKDHIHDGNQQHAHKYRYESLRSKQHFRLIRLDPGKGHEPLHCSLIQFDLDICGPYEALSYTWGEEEDQIKVNCDHKYIAITRNLFQALLVFRRRSAPRYLWADAICIDQQDLSERSAQVQLMARIYSGAIKVLLWLGPEDSSIVNNAFRILRQSLTRLLDVLAPEDRTMATANDNATPWQRISMELGSWSPSAARGTLDEATINSLVRLLSRPAFQRGWIFQEFVLASSMDVYWGASHIDVNWLCLPVLTLVDEIPSLCRDAEALCGFGALSNMYFLRLFKTERMPQVLDVLSLARYLKFRDERDKIYGMLALHDSADGSILLEPDYTVDKREPYKQVARRVLLHDHAINVLFYVRHNTLISEDWPSWVPDWVNPEWTWDFQGVSSYPPVHHISTFRNESLGHECLSLRGSRVDMVDTVMGSLTSAESDEYRQTRLLGMWANFDHMCVAYTATAGRSITPSLLMGTFRFWDDESTALQIRACRAFLDHDLIRTPLPGAADRRIDQSSSDTELALRFGDMYKGRVKGMRFFQTQKGRLGLGPPITTKGDAVVLFGDVKRFAFLLRPAGTLWRLVGACYVYDIVREEAVRESKGYMKGETTEEFWIF